MKLEQTHKDLIKLIQRSPDIGNGWRNVGRSVQENTIKMIHEHPELYFYVLDLAGLKIKLSPKGEILAEYL